MKKSISFLIAFLISVSFLLSAFNVVRAADNNLSSYVLECYALEYSGRISGGTLYAIFSPDNNSYEMYWERWIVKFGPKDKMKEIKIRNVTKLSDDTVVVETAMGIFIFPSVLDNKCPTFNDKPIEVDNRSDWDKCK